ncbi:MAG: substrate-binding domain-containing protein [Eubacteriales bacterium]
MKTFIKLLTLATAAVLSAGLLMSCGNQSDTITVISREEGSGTRGAFVELFGIEEKDADGNKVDKTRADAEFYSSTSVVLSSVAGDPNAIGYVSLGSLKDTVKALEIDGVAATVENVKNGTYKITRPFNIATKEDAPELAQDFIAYILSAEGQAVVEANGYISSGNNGAYAGTKPEGSITVSGSSSISPLMEKLIEAYQKVNTGADIKLQQSDSSTGMSDVAEGKSEIGMASRELKDSELEKGLVPTVICTDGVAVIVSPENSVNGLTSEQIKKIYTGEISAWSELN